MANHRRENPTPFTNTWLVGISLLVLGFLTLLLMLGWFAYLELAALTAGLGVMSGLFFAYYWTHPDARWAAWASYLVLNVAAFFGVGFLLDFAVPHYIVWGAFLLGMPFLVIYLRQFRGKKQPATWWAAIPAGGLITLAASLLQFRLGWPDHLLPGILVSTFMGGLTFTLLMIWYPNFGRDNYRWLVRPIIVTALITLIGTLITIDLVILAPPLILLILGAYFLIRAAIRQWQYERLPEVNGPPTRLTPITPQLPISTATLSLPEESLHGDSETPPPDTIDLQSRDFPAGGSIPPRYTCDGDNVSPPLEWHNLPPGTAQLVLICDTPDSPGGLLTHWVLFNLPATVSALPAALLEGPHAPGGALQGVNDFGRVGYDGPCPPAGRRQRYYFKLYALDSALPVTGGTGKKQVIQAMQGHILATGQLQATYARTIPRPDSTPAN